MTDFFNEVNTMVDDLFRSMGITNVQHTNTEQKNDNNKNEIMKDENTQHVELQYNDGKMTAKINGKEVDWQNEDDVKALHDHVDDLYNGLLTNPLITPWFSTRGFNVAADKMHSLISDYHSDAVTKALEAKKEDEDPQEENNEDDVQYVFDEDKAKALTKKFVDGIDKSGNMSDASRANVEKVLMDFAKFCYDNDED